MMLGCILFILVIPKSPLAIQSRKQLSLKRESQQNEGMLFMAFGFPKGKRSTDRYSILAV